MGKRRWTCLPWAVIRIHAKKLVPRPDRSQREGFDLDPVDHPGDLVVRAGSEI
ncbi:MAG TPA: hypothetical protein VF992_04285 [Thermoplasmata archaeon]